MNDDTSGWKELGRTSFTSSATNIPYLDIGSTTGSVFTASTTTDDTIIWSVILSDMDWMPYKYVEYEPKWHKKFARYKLQMQSMWD